MNRVKALLAASIALALTFTISCSDDKDDGGNPNPGTSRGYCKVSGDCYEIPNNECSRDFYASYPEGEYISSFRGYTFEIVSECANPKAVCFYGIDNCGMGVSKSYCEGLGKKAFKTPKECADHNSNPQ